MDKFEAVLSDRSYVFKPARYIDALVAANSSYGLFCLSLRNRTVTWVPATGTLRKNCFSRKRRESSVDDIG